MTGPNSLDQSDRMPMVLGAGLAALGSFGVLTAMVDQRHLDFAPGLAAGGYPGLGPSGALIWCAGLLILSAAGVLAASVLIDGSRLATAVPCAGLWCNCPDRVSTVGVGWFLVPRVGPRWPPCGWQRGPECRVMVAVLVAVLVPLGLRAVLQVGPEHSAMVALWESDREGFLEQRGWAPEGEEAQVFERRLYEAVPTGWFVSPNIFSTVICRVGLLGAVLVATCLVAGGVGCGMVAAARRLEGSTGRFWSGRLGVLLAAIGARGATVGAL